MFELITVSPPAKLTVPSFVTSTPISVFTVAPALKFKVPLLGRNFIVF